ncbi:PAS domain-containing hybrid sensor histidine kinase/response regulator [Pseudomonas amygdali]|uniref:PAS domain-containing hybrid sensor histidine kinase/response regulator n=1 Tax=Pseudomonas amygdali TaxID=47877 RepID=UPI0001CC1C24|nr:PAS domain-containing hybrid sensor histidine kinase/response regulator [Pseudomonas amygdali]KWT13229.1 histidine kinase [Pseudomonas amygdali pv. aesculi]KWT17390.1 histidine kinase [Pseudomonas amygdali pv. aesculi]KWT28440.1 histidine kinase [Pseudomonas amygdali pv. aesculi]KWT29784.1 histidine kinase [Pseudomonas amygdali pv. aesculi]KWT40092.1 histidine kinase [Pseudomonas amygdali pv. aesculi]
MDALPTHLLQLALQSADLGVWMLDLERDQEVLRSLRHDQIFGYETLQPQWGLEIALTHIVEEDRHILTDAFERARTVGSLSCEFRVRWPDGSIHWVSPLGRTEFSEGGIPLRVSGVVADITVRKQMEAESLQRSKMAAIGELTAGIAHDFNNILQGLGVSFELISNLARSGRFSAVPERARRGQELVQRAAMITHRLLAFSRRSPLTPCALDLASRLPDIVSLLRPTAEHHVNVTVWVSPNLPAIHVDSAQFEAAILNLLVNARDASPRGGNIEVTAQQAQDMTLAVDDDKTYQSFALIEVMDQGSGIPLEQLDQVFEPFFTTKPIGAGTGLGLSQVYGFANQSGGKVDLDSVLGVGTRVRMWLPFESSDSSTDAVVETLSPSLEQSSVIDKPTGRILLVDDEFEVRETMATWLKQLGHEVIVASDASGALERMREAAESFDLMISDIGLTGPMDGCELAYQCRVLYDDMPVLLVTGYAGDDLEKRLPPDTLVLDKPFDMPKLVAAIAKCVT